MSEVLFVAPVFKKKLTYECGGTILLATILKEKGINVDIYRYYESDPDASFDIFLKNSVANILSKKPKIVSFYCRGDVYLTNLLVAKRIKEIRPETYIIFGGPHADVACFDTINEIPWVDYCCSGEGETTVYPLFNGLLKGKDVSAIRGLTYRNATGEIISNPRPELIADLDTLPFIDYSLLPNSLLSQTTEKANAISIDVGRGCPYNCAYCSTSLFWQRKFRLKSPARIVAEIKSLNEEFGITQFGFSHDLFTANKKLILEFCRILKESGLKIEWSCSSRADTIDEEMIDEMASAGLTRIYLGIETGSKRMQSIIHKNLNIEKTKQTLKYLVDKNLMVTVSFIYGFPEETEEDLEETLKLAYELFLYNKIKFQFHFCAIFPGTEYFNKYKDQMVWSENISDQVGSIGVKENIDFIHKHKKLFPFYYEYHNELRSRFFGLNDSILLFLEIYDYINLIDPEKFTNKRIVDLYLDFKNANIGVYSEDYYEHILKLFSNYISTIYDKEEAQIISEYVTFKCDLRKIKNNKSDTTDIKLYNIDIDAVINGKQLKDIEKRTSMVYITMVNNKITCGVQYLD